MIGDVKVFDEISIIYDKLVDQRSKDIFINRLN